MQLMLLETQKLIQEIFLLDAALEAQHHAEIAGIIHAEAIINGTIALVASVQALALQAAHKPAILGQQEQEELENARTEYILANQTAQDLTLHHALGK